MVIQILRDLRGLRVHVVHPPDTERTKLVEHLRRIGCMVETHWPVPDCWVLPDTVPSAEPGVGSRISQPPFSAAPFGQPAKASVGICSGSR